ncbi:MAG: hypothetical protein KAS39_04040, partial [Actinomycetia bacterium]|nr:hypothetical protein [Actinomycetes bacterium]
FSFLLIKQSLGLRTGYILGFPFNSILPKRVIYDIPPILFFVSCFAGGLWIGSKTKFGYFRPVSLSVLLVIIFTIIARALNLSASYAIFFEEVFTELKTSLPISVWSTFLYMPLALLGFIGGSFFIKMKRKIASIFKGVTARSAH